MFSILPKTNFNFSAKFDLSSANTFNLDQSKNLSFGKELNNDSVFFTEENVVGIGDNVSDQHCLLFPYCFKSIPQGC